MKEKHYVYINSFCSNCSGCLGRNGYYGNAAFSLAIRTFVFFDDSIRFHRNGDAGDEINYKCYIKAVKLGYYVPQLSELINN